MSVENVQGKQEIRILRIIARLNIGGPAIQAIHLTRALNGQGYASLLVCGQVGPYEGDMAYLAREQGVRPHEVEGLGREISPGHDARVLLDLLRRIRRFRPHVIHTHTAKAGTLGRLAGLLWNAMHPGKERIRLVHTFHGHVFHSYFSRRRTALFSGIERFLARFTDRIVVISPGQKQDICHRYRIAPSRKVTVIPLGFDLEAFSRDQQEDRRARRREFLGKACEEGCFLTGLVGRLAPVKNPRMLLAAIKELEEQGLDKAFCFVFVGGGELRQPLEREAEDLGVSARICFAGWQNPMAPVYAGLDAVVLTSMNEGTPVSLIEAMAAGRPIVATAVGGVPDLLGPVGQDLGYGVRQAERGLVIPSGDDRALAHALIVLRENTAETAAMTQRAKGYALAVYSLERLVRDVKRLYREVTGRAGERGKVKGERLKDKGGRIKVEGQRIKDRGIGERWAL